MLLSRFFAAQGVALVLACSAGTVHGESLTIAGDEWCPVNCEVGSQYPGIFVELAQEIFAEAGISVEYQTMNWARTLHLVRRGDLNAAIGAGVEDAPDFLFHATPLALSRNCFYTRTKSKWQWNGPASLETVRLGVINDYSYGDMLNAYIEAHRGNRNRVQLVSGDKALVLNVGKLLRGRVDVILENPWVIQNALKNQKSPAKLREAGCRTPDVPIYLAFSPELESSKRYIELLEDGIKRYRANGRLQALFERYGVSEH